MGVAAGGDAAGDHSPDMARRAPRCGIATGRSGWNAWLGVARSGYGVAGVAPVSAAVSGTQLFGSPVYQKIYFF